MEATLGADFVSQESVSFLPKKEKTLKLTLDPSAKVLEVFGSFKQHNTIWKATVNLPKATDKLYFVKVLVDSKRISIL